MSKLSFRARALDASKPLPIYLSEELPDLQEYSAINRTVPQMPSGMEKEEECEHHLQRAIVTGLIIPTPEVSKMPDLEFYNRVYPPDYKPPRQLIRMQPFAMEEDYPDYDIDSEDEKWLSMQKLDITPRKFEEMMDRLEKNCAQNFASQDRKELLLKDDDELSIAIYDYWLSKRLKTPQALVPTVRTELNRGTGGNQSNNNPYLAFRRRTEKMQTRKNRKNDEASYEKMLKLKRDLTRALQLLELVKKREALKRDGLQSTIQLYEARYKANDMNGALLAEVMAMKSVRPAFTPLYTNQYNTNHSPWALKPPKEEIGLPRKEKRQYKKRKHKGFGSSLLLGNAVSSGDEGSIPESAASPSSSPAHPASTAFPFFRNKNCSYHAPLPLGRIGLPEWEEGRGKESEKYRFHLTSVGSPPRCIGYARRRIGRGGRVILDRVGPSDDYWSSLDFKIQDSAKPSTSPPIRHFRPKTPPKSPSIERDSDVALFDGDVLSIQVESLADSEVTKVDLNLSELFPDLEVETVKRDIFGCGSCKKWGSGPSTPAGISPGGGGSVLERWAAVTQHRSSAPTLLAASPTTTSYLSQPSSSADVGSSVFSVAERTNPSYSSPKNISSSGIKASGSVGPSSCSPTVRKQLNIESPHPSTQCDDIIDRILNGPVPLAEQSVGWVISDETDGILKSEHTLVSPLLNSKLAGRANSSQISSELGSEGILKQGVAGANVTGVSGSQQQTNGVVSTVVRSQAMGVT